MSNESLPLIGWKERIQFTEWGLESVLTKVDTGAQTSTIDSDKVELLPRGRVRFDVIGRRRPAEIRKTIEADIVRMGNVRSSNGRLSERVVVVTRVSVGDTEFLTEFTLSKRPRMRCRVLLGRAALEGRFLVDTDNIFLQSSPKRRRTKS